MKSLMLFSLLLFINRSSTVLLKTKLGVLEGKETTSRDGRTFYLFNSVPYAKPPVGDLRLKNPVPYPEWSNVLKATSVPPVCKQVKIFFPKLRNITVGEEDCLFLRIATPFMDSSARLPVLVYIHGGGFQSGSPGPETSPRYFMDENVVLILVQYRLGILGFLSTEDAVIPGNFGLKDQAMALKWIKENIDAFGGDPEKIVIFGESAGGVSVHFHALSHLSKDLIKGVIAQSGVADATWALVPRGVASKRALQVASKVGCKTTEALLSCLQRVPVDNLTKIVTDYLIWDSDPFCSFGPIVETDLDGAFLTKHPRDIQSDLPFITGMNSGEGNIKIGSLINQEEAVMDDFIAHIDKYLPYILFIDSTAPGLKSVLPIVKQRYFKNLEDKRTVMDGLANLITEYYSVYPLHLAVRRHQGPKFVYLFDHKSENSIRDLFGPVRQNFSSPGHNDELLSLLDFTPLFPGTRGQSIDVQVSRRLIHLWAKFAENLTPTDGVWKEYEDGNYFHITSTEQVMKKHLYEEVSHFWNETLTLLRTNFEQTQL